MKAILVIDMPESYMGSVIDVKLYGKEKVVHEHYVNKLKPLPQKRDECYYYGGELAKNKFAVGYNTCLDEIENEIKKEG